MALNLAPGGQVADPIHPTLTIKIDDSEEFVFRVPTPFERARLGVREAAIRRTLDPLGGGFTVGVDDDTFFLIRGFSIFEVLLERSSQQWPYTEHRPDKGEAQLIVDITKFPPGKEGVIMEVGRRFQESLDEFHGTGDRRGSPDVSEAVAGGVDPGSLQPVAQRAA